MQGRDHGDVPDEVSFINTQLSGRYAIIIPHRMQRYGAVKNFPPCSPQISLRLGGKCARSEREVLRIKN